MRHLVELTPGVLAAAAEGLFLSIGKVPKSVKMIDTTLGAETEVIRESSSDPLAFVNGGKHFNGTATMSKLTAGAGIDAFQGNESTTDCEPVEYKPNAQGTKAYYDHTGREILAFSMDTYASIGTKAITFDVNGTTITYTEDGTTDAHKFADGTTALTAATNLATAINLQSSTEHVTAVADGIKVYLIQEAGYVVDNLVKSTTVIAAFNQPVVYDIKGNLMNADPNLKSKVPKGIKIASAIMTAAQVLQFDIVV